MYCNKCGNEIIGNPKYCNKCGNILSYDNSENITKNDSNNNSSVNNANGNFNNNVNTANGNINNNVNTANGNINNNMNTVNRNIHNNVNVANNNINNNLNNNIRNNYNNYNGKKNNKTAIIIFAIVAVILVVIILIAVFNKGESYYFNNNSIDDDESKISSEEQTTSTKGKYKTAIITDNVYTGVSIKSEEEAYELIEKDSVDQKKSDYPKEIIDIENDIINKYSIAAVNLKEMDVEFAKELEKVIDKIYKDYPKARGYLTNMTLTNLSTLDSNVIALFMPVFTFGLSKTNTTRPWVIKTQIQLNAKYFLNENKLVKAVESSSKAGHFPPNATKYSPVAHELGHYLSFIALMNSYSEDSILLVEDDDVKNFESIFKDFANDTFSIKMLKEAYQNYVNDKGNIDFDEWRGQISKYALAKDESGDYIYDETIAEAFHDVYLNGNNAKDPSKYIVEVLKKYVNK